MLTSSQDMISEQALNLGVTECFSKSEPGVFEDYVNQWVANSTSKLSANVLLIEDSALQAAQIEKTLSALGLTTTRSSNGEASLSLIAKRSFDLVLVDYILEGTMTGLNVIRLIRALPGRSGKIPILAISGFDDPARRIEMLRSGANDFIPKPVIPEELQVRASNLIQLRQAQDFLEEQHAILYEMAMRDRLTSLFNRHYINERAQTLMQESRSAKRPMSLIVLDVDHFKRINDTHGHAVGDFVLVSVASAISEYVGEQGIVARIGGEEFMILLPDCDEFCATSKAEKLREIIEDLSPSGLRVTASFGVTQLRPEDNYDMIFSRADMAMYEAKRSGRNCVITTES
jgi:two-component system cell cycle response regulator